MSDQVPGSSKHRRTMPLTNTELQDKVDKMFDSDEDSEPFAESEESWPGGDSTMDDSDENCDTAATGISMDTTARNVSIEDEDTTVDNTPVWSDTFDKKNFAFTAKPGLKVPVQGNDPYDYFSLLLTDAFFEHLAEQTNLYAEEVFLKPTTNVRSRITTWKPVTVPEVKIFFALWLHMGNIQLNRLPDYWKTDELYSIPCFHKYMSRNRFLLILRCLHIAENPKSAADPGYGDRLHKIRWLQDYFNKKMEEIYIPEKELSFDESMVLWRGRLQFRQYIKGKYGMKLYILAQPEGTVLRCCVYSGHSDDLGGQDYCEKVVLSLMKGLENYGYSLYMDNFYNSVHMSQILLQNGTYVTGTLRKNRRDNPKSVTDAKLLRGEVVTKYYDGISVGKWHDKRDVLFISTEHDEEILQVQRKSGDIVRKPKAIVRYNQFMTGADRQDQMLAYYPSERKNMKWYKKLIIHFTSMLLLNSYFFYKKYSVSNKIIPFYDFRILIIKKLLEENSPKISRQSPELVELVELDHTPIKLEKQYGKQSRKRCRVCYQNKIRKATPYYCPSCKDAPGLCLGECFTIYHNK